MGVGGVYNKAGVVAGFQSASFCVSNETGVRACCVVGVDWASGGLSLSCCCVASSAMTAGVDGS